MNEFEYTVTVEYKDGTEDIEIYIDLDDFADLDSNSEKIKYVKKLAKAKSDDINKVLFDNEDLKDLEREIDDLNDTSWAHPNETWEEFVEHEDFGM